MGRKSNPENRWLKEAGLKHVTISRGRFVYRPYLGKGKLGKEIPMLPVGASRRDIIQRYEEITEVKEDTLNWLLTIYKERAKAPKNLKNYEHMQAKLIADIGDVKLRMLDHRSIQDYLDYMLKDSRGIAGNRNVEHLRAAWNWGLNRFDQVPPKNPCLGVDFNDEAPRTRLIEQHEYDAVYQVARAQRLPYLAVLMELSYLCRMRAIEARNLLRSDITESGVLVRRAKGSKDEITLWSERLRSAVALAESINHDVISPYLLCNKDGKPITDDQRKAAWDRALRKTGYRVMENGKVTRPAEFTFHDIKAMGVTHHPEKASGHKTRKMEAIYDRLPTETASTR